MSTCFSSVLSPTKNIRTPQPPRNLFCYFVSEKRVTLLSDTSLRFYFSLLIAAVYPEYPVLYLLLFNMMFLVGI